MNNKLKKINWWRIVQVFCLFVFMAQIFVLIQIVLFQHYVDKYSVSDMVINLIIFYFALACVLNFIPKDFHMKEVKK